MNTKSKTVKNIVFSALAVLALILASHFLGVGTSRNAIKIGYIGNEGRGNWSGSYVLLNGNMTRAILTESGTLSVDVETKAGEISIEIKDSDGKIIFEEDNIGTKTFNIDVSGKAVVHITADNHKGSFSIVA